MSAARLADVAWGFQRERASERRRLLEECGKRVFPSRRAALDAHVRCSWRLRLYFCEPCHGWHATNKEKRA